MSADEGGGRVSTISVPADASALDTLRLFASRVAVAATEFEDRLDDLRLVVTEACAQPDGASVTVSIEVMRAGCIVSCSGVAAPDEGPDGMMRSRLLAAIAHDLSWERDASGVGTLRCTVPLGATA